MSTRKELVDKYQQAYRDLNQTVRAVRDNPESAEAKRNMQQMRLIVVELEAEILRLDLAETETG